MNYRKCFELLTGSSPYPWQERLQTDLASGRSVILRVPTGAGKTWAAVAPFLYGMEIGKPLADRMLYALPLRSLASSLYSTVRQGMDAVFGDVKTHGKDRTYAAQSCHIALQIGGQKNDPFFESDVVFTTIDQLLSSYLFMPVSLPDRLGNMNAGALIGSLIVFDELHLLDPDVALGTTIEMLDRLEGLCQFVLMTATMSDAAIQLLAGKLNAVVAAIPDTEIYSLPTQQSKRRSWNYVGKEINAEAVQTAHQGNRTIALMNTVSRAQELFLNLERRYESEANPPELILLHSRYYPADREKIESRLDRFFGPKAEASNVILVTTQVIEAGMDISADQLHTEIAPMNALIQRAGRTARFRHRSTGSVIVYEAKSLGPYREQADMVESTRARLKELPADGKPVDFVEERNWIQSVHANHEANKLHRFSVYAHRRLVSEAMDEGQRGRLTDLVREIDSVNVLIAEDPESIDFSGRAWPRLLGVPSVSLMTLRKQFPVVAEGHWVAMGAEEAKSTGERPGFSIEWKTLSASELRAQWLVALHPSVASYDARLGLMLNQGGVAPPIQISEPPSIPRYQYQFEPWAEHAQRIVAQARAMRTAYTRAAELMAARYLVTAELIEELTEVVCILHDVGKLTELWQKRAWLWQNDKDSRMRAAGHKVPARPTVPLAHTWFDTVADRPWQRDPKYNLPNHSVEGAFAVAAGLEDRIAAFSEGELGELIAACVYTAIARHHGPRSSNLQPFELSAEAPATLSEKLPKEWAITLDACQSRTSAADLSRELLKFARERGCEGWPLYTFLVRRLRLADQASLRTR
jgi:CRISPR-associated endonuclease/helicase Cas3